MQIAFKFIKSSNNDSLIILIAVVLMRTGLMSDGKSSPRSKLVMFSSIGWHAVIKRQAARGSQLRRLVRNPGIFRIVSARWEAMATGIKSDVP